VRPGSEQKQKGVAKRLFAFGPAPSYLVALARRERAKKTAPSAARTAAASPREPSECPAAWTEQPPSSALSSVVAVVVAPFGAAAAVCVAGVLGVAGELGTTAGAELAAGAGFDTGGALIIGATTGAGVLLIAGATKAELAVLVLTGVLDGMLSVAAPVLEGRGFIGAAAVPEPAGAVPPVSLMSAQWKYI
jgi:hypothetical protein